MNDAVLQFIKQYLLGELNDAVRQRLEKQMLIDNALYIELLITEDGLIDQYVSGELTAYEQERFERHFLATFERREKLMFARVLQRYIAKAIG